MTPGRQAINVLHILHLFILVRVVVLCLGKHSHVEREDSYFITNLKKDNLRQHLRAVWKVVRASVEAWL